MRKILQELCQLLSQQKDVLEEMLELSRQERDVIIAGDSEKLEGIVRLELKGLSKLGQIEKMRTELHKTLSLEFGIAVKDLTVTAIAKCAEPDEREEIVKLQTELTRLIAEHTTLNNENRELINQHLEYSEAMLDLMIEPDDPLNNFYGGDGRAAEDKRKTTGFFDGQA